MYSKYRATKKEPKKTVTRCFDKCLNFSKKSPSFNKPTTLNATNGKGSNQPYKTFKCWVVKAQTKIPTKTTNQSTKIMRAIALVSFLLVQLYKAVKLFAV